jgi:putative lipoic acid-binding regulatory protein
MDKEYPQGGEPELNLLTFPCEFKIKAFGLLNSEFETTVIGIIKKHVADLKETAFSQRLSKDNKYVALTISIIAESRAQLDAIYQDLSANPIILMTL